MEEICLALRHSNFIYPILFDREPGDIDDAALVSTYEAARRKQRAVSADSLTRWQRRSRAWMALLGELAGCTYVT